MKICLFSSKPYDQYYFDAVKSDEFSVTYLTLRLTATTARLANGFDVVCCFVNDQLNSEVLNQLNQMGVKLVALRCAGFNNVDLDAAKEISLPICRVPEYSPYAVAEHACALILDLNRNIHRAHNRVRENDYSLDGLLGFDMHGKNVGVIGAGKIGLAFVKIMQGFGCKVSVVDPVLYQTQNESHSFEVVSLDELLSNSDIISLHCPLTSDTYHLIDEVTINKMKTGVMLINTSRGGLADTSAIIKGLKSKKIGYLGIDVYEEESELFFEDLSDTFIQDDVFARLQTFPNVMITGHQGFFTKEALTKIAAITNDNIQHFIAGRLERVHMVTAVNV